MGYYSVGPHQWALSKPEVGLLRWPIWARRSVEKSSMPSFDDLNIKGNSLAEFMEFSASPFFQRLILFWYFGDAKALQPGASAAFLAAREKSPCRDLYAVLAQAVGKAPQTVKDTTLEFAGQLDRGRVEAVDLPALKLLHTNPPMSGRPALGEREWRTHWKAYLAALYATDDADCFILNWALEAFHLTVVVYSSSRLRVWGKRGDRALCWTSADFPLFF